MCRLWRSEVGHATRKLGHTVTTSKWEWVLLESLGNSYSSIFVFEGEWVKIAFVKSFSVLEILSHGLIKSQQQPYKEVLLLFLPMRKLKCRRSSAGAKFTWLGWTQTYVSSTKPTHANPTTGPPWMGGMRKRGSQARLVQYRTSHQNVGITLGS